MNDVKNLTIQRVYDKEYIPYCNDKWDAHSLSRRRGLAPW